jgi:5-methylcytosine-specific restriction endonuclease McrA
MTQLKDLNLHDIGNTIQLTGAVYSGNGKHYLTIFPDEHGTDFLATAEILEMDHSEWETFLRQTDYLETEMRTVDPATGQLMRAVVRKSQRQVDQNVSWKVFRRDSFHCRYCGKNDVPLTVDHLVLWEEGGPSTEVNLVSACKKCNRTRGNMQYSDWLKSDYYKHVSDALDSAVVIHNLDLITTLNKIPRLTYKRSR